MKLEGFSVSVDHYQNGKRVDFGKDVYLTVRSAKSERATAVRKRLMKPYASWREDLPADLSARVNADWCAQGLLAAMVGFSLNGQDLVFDLDKPEDQQRLSAILRQPQYSALRERIIGIAVDDAFFQLEDAGGIEGKSATSPAGSSASDEAQSS